MDRTQSMTTLEYAVYRRLKGEVTLNHCETTPYEKRSLNSLVKKGLVIKIDGGWTVDANATKGN